MNLPSLLVFQPADTVALTTQSKNHCPAINKKAVMALLIGPGPKLLLPLEDFSHLCPQTFCCCLGKFSAAAASHSRTLMDCHADGKLCR